MSSPAALEEPPSSVPVDDTIDGLRAEPVMLFFRVEIAAVLPLGTASLLLQASGDATGDTDCFHKYITERDGQAWEEGGGRGGGLSEVIDSCEH